MQRPALHASQVQAGIFTPSDTACTPETEPALPTETVFCMQDTTFLCTRSVLLSNCYYCHNSSPAY